jgi:predicted RNase H-like HicB family nuclease
VYHLRRTREEALARAREAIEGFIEGLEKAGEPVSKEVTLERWKQLSNSF